jgi:hypothetical protein
MASATCQRYRTIALILVGFFRLTAQGGVWQPSFYTPIWGLLVVRHHTMHRRLFVLLTILLIATSACSPPNEQVADRGRPAFKGVELYSWMDQPTQEWRFVLLPGTNRSKAAQEILTAPDIVRSVNELKARVSELPSGESVFWVEPGQSFSVPAQSVVNDIVASGAAAGVTVHVVRR